MPKIETSRDAVIGAALRASRMAAGMSPEEFAAALDATLSYVSAVERGSRTLLRKHYVAMPPGVRKFFVPLVQQALEIEIAWLASLLVETSHPGAIAMHDPEEAEAGANRLLKLAEGES